MTGIRFVNRHICPCRWWGPLNFSFAAAADAAENGRQQRPPIELFGDHAVVRPSISDTSTHINSGRPAHYFSSAAGPLDRIEFVSFPPLFSVYFSFSLCLDFIRCFFLFQSISINRTLKTCVQFDFLKNNLKSNLIRLFLTS